MKCPIYWQSHGCDLGRGHVGNLHRCGSEDHPCSEFEITDPNFHHEEPIPGRRRDCDDDHHWGEWWETTGFYVKGDKL